MCQTIPCACACACVRARDDTVRVRACASDTVCAGPRRDQRVRHAAGPVGPGGRPGPHLQGEQQGTPRAPPWWSTRCPNVSLPGGHCPAVPRPGCALPPSARRWASEYSAACLWRSDSLCRPTLPLSIIHTRARTASRTHPQVYEVSEGSMAMAITRADGPTGEVSGVFVAEQLSDSDMGAKAPKKAPRAHTHAAAYTPPSCAFCIPLAPLIRIRMVASPRTPCTLLRRLQKPPLDSSSRAHTSTRQECSTPLLASISQGSQASLIRGRVPTSLPSALRLHC